ncbi:hypothetical protein NIES4073_44280 [Kalymmatonema gypsitolerans NIES-4073]|nr:hypothetical protein NIES4073_44280 [Scytonema sp. NIES-4073]
MSLQSLKEQARQLSVSERLELVSAIIESLQDGSRQQPERSPPPGALCAIAEGGHRAIAHHQTDERFVENRSTGTN